MKRIGIVLGLCYLMIAMTCPLAAQSWINKKTISGKGELVKQKIELDEFTGIGLGIKAVVYLTQGKNYSIEIEAQQNIIDALKKEVKDDQWNISFEDKLRVRNYQQATIWITLPTLTKLAIGGTGEIIGKTPFQNLGNLELSIGGSGDIQLAGAAKNVTMSIAGSGTIRTDALKVAKATISIAGSGKAYVHLDDGDLDVSVAGSGKVFYKGKARVAAKIAGSGTVKSME